MKHRKLRIAWSMIWGAAAVVLAVVWGRSYSHGDVFWTSGPPRNTDWFASFHGSLRIAILRHIYDDITPEGRESLSFFDVPYWQMFAIAAVSCLLPWVVWLRNNVRVTARKLQIAWSVTWGIAAVLLVAFWVRSYWTQDSLLFRKNTTIIAVFTSEGIAGGYYRSSPTGTIMGNAPGFEWLSAPITARTGTRPFLWNSTAQGLQISLPAGCFVGGILLLAAVVWLPLKRFSLRTLLIATTLISVGLGAILWMAWIYRHFLP